MLRDSLIRQQVDSRLMNDFYVSRYYMNFLSDSNRLCTQSSNGSTSSHPKTELINKITVLPYERISASQSCVSTSHQSFVKETANKNVDENKESQNHNKAEIKDANNSSNVAGYHQDFSKCVSEQNVQNSTFYTPTTPHGSVLCSNLPSLNNSKMILPKAYCLPNNATAPLAYMQNSYHANCLTTEGNLLGSASVFVPNLGAILNRFRTRRTLDNYDPAHKKCSMDVLQYIYTNFLDQTSCDVIVRTRDGDIMCHQLVLGTYSPTIDSYLKNSKKNLQNTLLIKIQDCSLEAVADSLNFLYTTDILLNCLNIGFITDVSTQLDLTLLCRLCNDYLVQTVEIDNAFLHLSVALNNNFIGAIEILKFIALNFYDLIEHEHLMILPYDKFLTIITHPMLSAKEIEVFRAVVNWVNCNRPGRIQHARSLLGMIRFNLIDPGELVSDVEMQDWIFTDSNCKNIILEAYKYIIFK
ncbi:hypothetical protein HELRODRAFT_164283 [Helobdella robusta]|uniref:BTB domain-containing protein n=1 Tax=Helobdella robusta TaxID=6412 RepID=T1EV73_HELRO|nr:hypothetical protein HELRODRAFT_164283 [Helobdella robusta]ESN94439.1 hypothetical protein HELRODRAFT_164283 [Helobdella robusta]